MGPKPASHEQLKSSFAALPPPPTDHGRVALIVCRHAPGIHEALDRASLSPREGVPGDEWNRRNPDKFEAQLTVIRRDVAQLLSAGQPLTTSGDNLVVDLDISAGNLPVGTTLRVGEAIVEVSPKPHNGCRKFAKRFGEGALKFVEDPLTRHLNLRGIYWKVIERGEVTIGSDIKVLTRPNRPAC